MKLEEFITTYHNRAPGLMWFLGAGASASAGIPTAGDMIWDFKRTLYCASNKLSLRSVPDVASSAIRTKIQQYFDSLKTYPPVDSAEEYAAYFESLHRTEADRRKYIDRLVSAATPSYGHMVLSSLFRLNLARIVWTTNFDRVLEDSSSKIFGTSSKLVVSTLDTPALASEAIKEERWPLLIKLHGDFQSRRLKNTSPELQNQDALLRDTLHTSCQSFGLAVLGYSGRDTSIMDSLEASIVNERSYPSGLFWFHRSDANVPDRVNQLIKRAAGIGIDAHLVSAETFDEVMADLLNLVPDTPEELIEILGAHAPRVSNAPLKNKSGSYPLIRLNALPIFNAPTTCRRILCDIGGHKEVREAIEQKQANIIASRRNIGVLAFGSDEEVKKAFGEKNIREFDLHSIEPKRLRRDTAEMGLLYEAITVGITRTLPLLKKRRGGKYLLVVDPSQVDDARLSSLNAIGQLSGIVTGTDVHWYQGLRIKLEYKLDRLWFLMEPTVWADLGNPNPDFENDEQWNLRKHATSDFIREKLATRYNSNWNQILDAWVNLVIGQAEFTDFSTFGISNGVDAVFRVGHRTGYSLKERTI